MKLVYFAPLLGICFTSMILGLDVEGVKESVELINFFKKLKGKSDLALREDECKAERAHRC